MSHGLTYHDVDLSGENYGVYVVSANIQRMPQPRVNIDEYAQADGGAVQGSTFGLRRIGLDCVLVASTVANRATQITNVLGVLNLTQGGGGDLIIQMFPDRIYKNARITNAIDAEVSGRMEKFQLQFVCDPWPESATVDEETGGISGTGVTTL